MGNIAFWATVALNIPDFSRYAKSNGSQFWGQMLGMPIPMAFCAFVGAYFAQSTKIADGVASFDPTDSFLSLRQQDCYLHRRCRCSYGYNHYLLRC